MSFFWPTQPNPDPGFFAGMGRLLHWGSVAIALLLLWSMAHLGGDFSPAGLAAAFWPAAAIAMLGRGLRYVMASE